MIKYHFRTGTLWTSLRFGPIETYRFKKIVWTFLGIPFWWRTQYKEVPITQEIRRCIFGYPHAYKS